MRLFLGFIILLLYFAIVPNIIGIVGSNILFTKKKICLAEAFIWGNIIIWVMFEILCISAELLQIRFTYLTIVFGVMLVLLLFFGGYFQRALIKERIKDFLSDIHNINKTNWFIFSLILIQVCISAFFVTYIGADDAGYIAISLDAVEKDVVAQIDYYTGMPTNMFPIKIAWTSWNYYLSFLAKISGLHVAALAHTFVPAIFIPMAYIVYFLLARIMFSDDKKKITIFLFWINLLIAFGGYSWYTVTLRLDICIWHGKAVMAAILLPFLFYFLLRTEYCHIRDFICILLIIIAICAMSLMGVGLSILIVLGNVINKYQRNYIKKNIFLIIVIGILALVALYYFIHISSFDNFSFDQIRKFFPEAVNMALGADGLYWNDSYIRIVYYVCMGYLILKRRKNRICKYLSRYAVWQYLIIFNPVVYYVAFLFLNGSNVYVRLYYILFIEIYMAYILTLILFEFASKKRRILCAIISSLSIITLGKSYLETGEFSRAQNIYKLPQEAIEICNILNNDSPDYPPRAIVNEQVNIYLRQYSSRIEMLYGRPGYTYNDKNIHDLIRNRKISMDEIVQLMMGGNCQYLVWINNQQDIKELKKLGGFIIGKTNHYVVIKMDIS